ncbi:MAG: efflux transporter outer membrane subunit [Prevotella sp.]
MKKKTIITILSATVLMSSCGLYNKYDRPEVMAKGLVRDAVSDTDTLVVNDTTSFGNLPWRSLFTDRQLQDLIDTALVRNTDLLNAAQNVVIAKAQLMSARLAYLPSLGLSPSGTISSLDGAKATQTYQLPIDASWSVDLFGNLTSSKRSAQMSMIAAKDKQMAVRSQVISNVANLYYTLLMLDRQQEILDELESITRETWQMMKLQMELGSMRSTGVQSAEAAYYSVQAKNVDMKRQIREAENNLSLLLCQPGQSISRGKLSEQVLPSEFSTGVALQLLNNRPDVHAAEMKLAACYHDVQTARSSFYPSITITGKGSFTNSVMGMGTFNPGKWILQTVGTLTQPIFQNGKLVAGLKVAKAQQEIAFNTWQNTVIKAGNEVSNALVTYNAYDEQSRLAERQVELYRKSLEDTRMLYTSNGSSYLEVISAQSDLLNAEISKVTNDFNKMQAVVSLYTALGGGTK